MGADARGHRGAAGPPLSVEIATAQEPDDVALVTQLFREYADSLGVDLSFQGFEQELAELPHGYDALLLARVDGRAVGCVGVRPHKAETCEMKRLYVRPGGRGLGVGRKLALAAIEHARADGYKAMRLDTLPTMQTAQGLYDSLGFQEIEPYRHNPIAGSRFLELRL
jgi:ribosomal protein S18 acetylase RimI-like enzyme